MIVKNIDIQTDEGLLEYHTLLQPKSPLFKEIEKKFNTYLDESNDSDLRDMYFSEDRIYSAKGAIQEAIEQIFEVMNENNLKQIDTNSPLLDLFSE